MSTPAATDRPVLRSAHRLRREVPVLRPLWWGAGFGLLGTEVVEVVALMLTTAAYGAVLSAGTLGFALRLAPMLLAPVITAALDRNPSGRARFARYSVLARAVGIALFLVAVTSPSAPRWTAYTLVALIAALDAVYLTATRATLPGLLRSATGDTRDLSRVNSMLVVQWNTVQVLAPPLVVWALSVIGVGSLLGLAVGTLLVAFVLLDGYVRGYPPDDPPNPPAVAAGPVSAFLQRLRAGFAAIRRDRLATALVLAAATGQGAVFTFSVAVPQLVGSAGWSTGAVLSLLAVGSILGARAAAGVRQARGQAAVVALATLGLGVTFLVLTTGAGIGALSVASVVIGWCVGVAAVPRSTLLQTRFGDRELGAALVSAAVLAQALMPFLPSVWEALATHAGRAWGFGLLGGLQFLTLAVAGWALRAHRSIDAGSLTTRGAS